MLLVLVLTAVAMAASDPWPDQEDDCYIMDSTCHITGEEEYVIGNIPWMPSITVCEDACRTQEGCTWFAWKQMEAFRMCYLYTSCPQMLTRPAGRTGTVDRAAADLIVQCNNLC